MFRTFKKISLRRVLPRTILIFAAAAIFFGVTGLGIIRVAAGPAPLDSLGEDALKGAYVSFDASRSLSSFASMSSNGATLAQYYMVSYGDGQYLALEAGGKYFDLLEEASAQSQQYYTADLEALSELGPVSGYVTELDEGLLDYFVSALESTGIYDEGEDVSARIIPLMVVADHVNWCSVTLVYIFTAIGGLGLLAVAVELIRVFSGGYQKRAKKAALAGASAEDLEKDFAAAKAFDNAWVGRLYTWHFVGPRTKVEKTSDIIWAFNRLDTRFLGRHRYSLSIYMTDRRGGEIRTATDGERATLAEAIAQMGYPFVYGYSQERAHMFAKDYPAFKALAKREAAARKQKFSR